MTHADIYEKFMIEYDKENVTTSYPSLTEYEIATLLDKAYLALIAQKFTGNNMRRVPFEGDEKAVEDLQPLVTEGTSIRQSNDTNLNCVTINLNQDVMYVIHVMFTIDDGSNTIQSAKQISSKYMYKFIQSINNKPWSKSAIYCIQGKKIIYIYGDLNRVDILGRPSNIKAIYTYIKYPQKFADKNKRLSQQADIDFELSDSMAEELINLALVMSTEIVESPRMQTKAQLRGLES